MSMLMSLSGDLTLSSRARLNASALYLHIVCWILDAASHTLFCPALEQRRIANLITLRHCISVYTQVKGHTGLPCATGEKPVVPLPTTLPL